MGVGKTFNVVLFAFYEVTILVYLTTICCILWLYIYIYCIACNDVCNIQLHNYLYYAQSCTLCLYLQVVLLVLMQLPVLQIVFKLGLLLVWGVTVNPFLIL